MAYSKGAADKLAINLVTAGLQSTSIKLHGVTQNSAAESFATADALYLTKLLAALSKALQTMGD